MKRIRLVATVVVSLFLLSIVSYSSQASLTAPAREVTSSQSGSEMFIENAGQFADGARFQMRGGDRTIWLADEAIWITILEPAEARPGAENPGLPDEPAAVPDLGVNLRLSFVEANPQPELEPFRPLTTTISYFIGNDPDRWAAGVPVWGGVRYADLYPGLDLELGGEEGMRLVCRAAGCQDSLAQVRLQVEGADSLALMDGGLVVNTAAGDFSLPWLEVVDGQGQPVASGGDGPSVAGTVVSSPLAEPRVDRLISPRLQNDVFLPLVMRPRQLLYSSFLGGSSEEFGYAIAVDAFGQPYVTGRTDSTDFPTTPGTFDPTLDGNMDIFVVKLDSAGSGLLYSTFLGGSGWEGFFSKTGGIAVDSVGQVYITGETGSGDFPTTSGTFDPTINGLRDSFVVKLNAAGNGLLYSTFLGGNGDDHGYSITVDSGGQAYVTGSTGSTDFPTTSGAFDTTHSYYDAFVVKLNAAGSGLVFSTFLGGSDSDGGKSIAVDSAGQTYVTGSTQSTDFPITAGAFDVTFNGGGDVYVVKLNAAGSGLLYATYLGGPGDEGGNGVAVDSAGQAFVTGMTGSTNFPTTPGAFDTTYGGSYFDAFAIKLNPAGNRLLYGTFLGGGSGDIGYSITVGNTGQAFITGNTVSVNFPTTPGAFDTTINIADAFLVELGPAGSELLYGTFLGGSDYDYGYGVALDDTGRVYITGKTQSNDFPTTQGAYDTTYNGGHGDAFVVKMVTGQ